MTTTDTAVETDSATPSRLIEILFAAVALAFSTTYLVLGLQIELRRAAPAGQIDARFWPLVLGTIAVAVSVALLVIAVTRPAPGREDIEPIQKGGVVRVVLTGVITLAYVAAWSFASIVAFGYRIELFPIVTAVYLFLLLVLYGQRRWLGLVLYPVVTTAFIYVLFGILLRIPL